MSVYIKLEDFLSMALSDTSEYSMKPSFVSISNNNVEDYNISIYSLEHKKKIGVVGITYVPMKQTTLNNLDGVSITDYATYKLYCYQKENCVSLLYPKSIEIVDFHFNVIDIIPELKNFIHDSFKYFTSSLNLQTPKILTQEEIINKLVEDVREIKELLLNMQ